MEIERAGITFDVTYLHATNGDRYSPGDAAEIEINDWEISNWDDLADMHGAKGDKPIVRYSVREMVDVIIEQQYDSMLEDAESAYYSDFDVDDYDGPEWEYEGV